MATRPRLRHNLASMVLVKIEESFLTLDLSHHGLRQLPNENDDLEDFNLHALDLARNKNIELSDDIRELTSLNVMTLLDDCNLVTITAVVMKILQVQGLILSNKKNITLPDEMSSLINLTALGFHSCNLDTPPPLVLNLSNLRVLDLSNIPDELNKRRNVKLIYSCQLRTIPPPQLEWLDLHPSPLQTLPAEVGQLNANCQLHTLPPEVGRLIQLEWLNLNGNPLRTLPSEVGQLTNIKHLGLSNCQLRTLPPEVGRLTQLEWLDLSSNPLQTLHVEVGQLTDIKHLDLSQCELHTIPPEMWKLKQLQWLDLSSNPLQTLPAEVGQLTNVKHLDLSNCQLRTHPLEMWRLAQLKRLNLSSNPLQTLHVEVGQLTKVKHLDLSNCQLRTLPPEVWRLTQLEWLDLSSNPLQTLPAEVGQLTNVKHFNLFNCELRTLQPEMWRLTQLEWLDLTYNLLHKLPAEVGQLTNVKHLDLSNCELNTLPPEVGRLTQLERLDLTYNPLRTLPAEIGQLINVKHLDLSHCQLRTLPPEVGRLTQLEWLNLHDNPLQTLPAEAEQLTNIKHLNLSDCQLHTLPPEVWRLTQIEWLDMRSNPLQMLPAEVGQLTNVKHLDVSDCQLNTLPPEVGRLTQLEWLDLSSNALQTLPAEVGQLNSLSHLDVIGNPLIKPPTEVSCKGIATIRQYFEELKRSEDYVSAHLKVVVLGEQLAGKTSLVRTLRCSNPTLTEEEDRTQCLEISQWAPDDNITFEVYDFGGHDVYHLTHQFFLTPDAFYLLLVNLYTYNCTEQRYTEAVGFWLDTLNARVPGAVVSLVGSKEDLCRRDDVVRKTKDIQRRINAHMGMWERQQKQNFARMTSIQASMHKGSKSMERLAHTACMLRQGLRVVGDVLCVSVKPKSRIRGILSRSPSWVHVRNLLLEKANDEALFPTLRRVLPRTWLLFQWLLQVSMETPEQAEKTDSFNETGSTVTIHRHGESSLARIRKQSAQHWLTLAECERIGRLAELSTDRLEPVLSYLQQVGTILRYTDIPELKDLVFHDPPALIEIFKDLFHHDSSALFSTSRFASFTSSQIQKFQSDLSNRGLIQKEVMTRLLPSDIKLDIVLALMQNFGLCFEVQDKTDPSKHTSRHRIPWYLQNQKPGELRAVWPDDVPEEQEQLQLMCDIRGFCPRGLFQRFSVGIHPLVEDRVDWKDGFMAYRQDYPVLVCSKPVEDDTYITMATRGRLAQAGEMWGVVHPLLEVLVQLLQEWPGVLYSLHVTCAHCIKASLDNPHQYELRDRTADDGRDVRCPHPEVKYTASTSADLVYRPGGIQGLKQHLRAFKVSSAVKAEVSGWPGVSDDFNRLRWLLTEVKVENNGYKDHYNRLAAHVSELGLTFRAKVPGDGNCMFHAVSDQVFRTQGRHIDHLQLREQAVDYLRRNPRNDHGDHLSDFIPNQTWEEYLETMSRDGTWGDHVVLQAMADMLGRDVIIVSSVEADNYVTVLQQQSGTKPETARSLLLGHYAENHYASLDETPPGSKPVVLLVIDEVGTSKGGISTINGQLGDLLTSNGVKVLCTVLNATQNEKREAQKNGIELVLPNTLEGNRRPPTLDWLTYDHKSRYPNLPSDISVIVGHADVTSTAARNIKKERLQSAKFILYNHVMPEDTEHHKSDDKAMGIGDKMEAIREDTEEADVVFSVGLTMHDYYKTQIKISKPHHMFLPKPSDVFSQMNVTYVETETKVVLTVGRVKGVEKLKGYDLVAKSMGKVLDRFPKARWRARGVSKEDFPESKDLIEANVVKGKVQFTPLEYGTQEQLSRDFKEAHLVLMPSRAEPFGLVGLEAIAAGVPVLVSSNSGLAEFLESKGPEFDRPIVDMDGSDDVVAERLAKRIIKVLKGGPAEFEAAKRLRDKLLTSKYWEESHRKFLEECGIPQ